MIGLSAALVLAAAAAGMLASHPGLPSYLVTAAAAIMVAAVIFAYDLAAVLIGWIAVEGIAYPFIRFPPHHDIATLDRFVILALGAALLFTPTQRLPRESRRLGWAFAIFAAVYGVRAVLTHQLPLPSGPNGGPLSVYQPEASWLDDALLPCIVFFVAARTMTNMRWRTAAKAFIVLGTSVGLLGIMEWAFGFELATLSGHQPYIDPGAGVIRAGGPYADPLGYGAVLIICIAVTLYWLQTQKARGVAAAALGIQLVALGPTYTKTVWAAALVAIIIAVGLRRRMSSRTLFVAIAVAVIAFVLYSFAQSSSAVSTRTSASVTSNNALGRVDDYVEGFQVVKQHYLAGVGVGNFGPAEQLVPSVTIGNVSTNVAAAHDTFLAVLGEVGLVGFIPLIWLVYSGAGVIRASRRYATTAEEIIFGAAVLAASVGYLILSLPFNELLESPPTILLALLWGAAAARLRAREPGVISQAQPSIESSPA